MYLVWAKDVRVVVEVTERAQSMFMLLELNKAITQRLSHHLTLLWLLVIHHSTLGVRKRRIMLK